jgi:hypothetical protein
MATTTRAPKPAPPKDAPELPDVDQADDEPVDKGDPGPTAAELRVRELEAELARIRAAAEPRPAQDAPPTHVQRLANGDLIETNAPVATFHSTEEGIFPVVATYPLPPREEV